MAANGVNKRNYILWDQEGVEAIPEGESQDIQEVANMINSIQRAQFNKHRHCFGGTHARTQGIVKGQLVVKKDLPPHLKQSLFAHEKTYPIAMRYSSEPGDPGLDDRIPQPRGLGMKVFNVEGEMLPAGSASDTQDIEFNSTPAIELSDAKTTKEIIGLRIKYEEQKELYKHLEARSDCPLQKGRDQVRNSHLESTRMYSQTAHRYGDYVIKYCLAPSSETQRKLYEETVKPNSDPDNILSEWLKTFYSQHEAEYLFQVQLLENIDDQPVEYAGVAWDADKYPWQTVGKLTIPKQDSFLPARKTFWEDHIRLDPWHGLKSFQPLGGTNRLRRVVYPQSSALRRRMNGRKEINVKSIDQIPDGAWVET